MLESAYGVYDAHMLVRVPLRTLVRALFIGVGLVAIAVTAYGYTWLQRFERELELHDSLQYANAEERESSLLSRRAMMVAMEVQKRQNLAPSAAVRLYAYVASVYADALDTGGQSEHAFLAALEILEKIVPAERQYIHEARTAIDPMRLSDPVRSVVDSYVARISDDGSDRIWDPATLPDDPGAWYIRGGPLDGGAASGSWKLWILEGVSLPQVPPPPVVGGVYDRLEMEKVRFATMERTPGEMRTIFLWHGASGFVKGARRDNISPAGVWQNILFVEKGDDLDDAAYAHAQKELAQGIADAFILTWREKYRYVTARPSMRDDSLSVALGDPPFPSYISGHSTISKAAAVVLSSLFPEKGEIWHMSALDARRTRLLGGIHFDIDNARG